MPMHSSHPTNRSLLAAAVTAVLAVTLTEPVMAQEEGPGAAATPSKVSVDFGAARGTLDRPERRNNFGNVTAWPQQRADDVAFLDQQGLRGDIYRIWLSSPNAPDDNDIFNTCDLKTKKCDFSRLDAYLDAASTVSDSVMVNLNPTDFIEGRRPMKDLQPMLDLILRELTANYPHVDYVEVFNEPDWQFHGKQRREGVPAEETTARPDDLYRYYVPFYKAVDKVNSKLRRSERLKMGGPALMHQDHKWLEPFLDDYAADRDPRKRLDFISYHSYLSWDDAYQSPTLYSKDLSQVADERDNLKGWLRERRLNAKIPAFVTETGIYPGPAFDDPDPTKDYLKQAAGLATYNYWYAAQDDMYLFNWCVRHRVEQRKDQLVTRTSEGPVTDTFTPYGNMMLMQSMMKDTRVSATSDAPLTDGDNGVYAMAAKDRSGASLMLWNWQHTHDTTYETTVDMSRLPSKLQKGPVRQRMYKIDATTSNYFANPAKANLQLVREEKVTPGTSHTVKAELSPNAIYLVVLEPA